MKRSGICFFDNNDDIKKIKPNDNNQDNALESKSSTQPETLIQALQQDFPIPKNGNFFKLYPLCNENGYLEVLKQLDRINTKNTGRHPAVLLFGNSNLPSILPELQKNTKLVVMADIDSRLHAHNQHILNCLKQAKTKEDFFKEYHRNNPIVGVEFQHPNPLSPKFLSAPLLEWGITDSSSTLELYGFLDNEQRFKECQLAAATLDIVFIHLDLCNPKMTFHLANLLQKYNTELLLCNFTNIHQYVDCELLRQSISLLLRHSKNSYLMYSTTQAMSGMGLTTTLTQDKDAYFNILEEEENAQAELTPTYGSRGQS